MLYANAQADLNLCILHTMYDNISLDTVHVQTYITVYFYVLLGSILQVYVCCKVYSWVVDLL